MVVLGIESSCDETAAAVVGPDKVLSDVVHSQQIHADYGGVVPELAARAHVEKLGVVVRAALERASVQRPDAVVATAGPGLIGAVLTGLAWGKALALGWGVPFLGVNHLEGHLLSALLEEEPPTWPFLSLVVSGGHTTLYRCDALGSYVVLGQTVDDAAGEAFDKTARLMGLGYPGGPAIDRLAAQGDRAAVSLPRPDPGALDWSFSGLKTAVRNHVRSPERAADADVCASFQAAVVDCLLDRVVRASEQTGITSLAIAGGVAANSELRDRVSQLPWPTFIPPRARCTDNGAMIANAGRLHLLAGRLDPPDVGARPGWQVGV
ncbi:MAG TPA: tRNA (adenosine(37)-N6)-threonylcarbamoyltransferase complex transferase subunit TsaD [Deltaproteobacteria bacterium]|nr:tRNA (adenosine(37)-N6)-threonylcarbamoyltransferase complex transferase subunit TsaD [Deltaproteobacteria bacterium]